MPITGNLVGYGAQHVGRRRNLDRFAGGPRSKMQEFLYFHALDTVTNLGADPHFVGDTLETNFWTTNAGTGATAFAVPATPGLGGTITGATGTDATAGNRVVNLYGAPVWSGDKNCGMEVRMQISAVTDIEFAVGFIDTHTTITTPIPLFGDIDTPTLGSGIGDAALVGLDTAETLTTLALLGVGSGGLAAAWKTNIGTLAPAAATYFTVRIQLSTNDVLVTYEDGAANETKVTKVAGIEGGTLVRPIIAISGPTNTSRTYTIDRVHVWQDE